MGGLGDMGIDDDAFESLVGGRDAEALFTCQGCSLEGAVAPVKVVPKQLVETLVA
jgi:hypothetical protein